MSIDSEADWLASTDPAVMLAHVQGRASARKLRLFAVACCQQVWGLLTDERSRRAVEVASRYADGEATERELREAHAPLVALQGATDASNLAWAVTLDQVGSSNLVMVRSPLASPALQAALLRCVVGNPFRPAALPEIAPRCPNGTRFAPGHLWGDDGRTCLACGQRRHPWLTPQVVSLATAAYDDRPSQAACGRCGGCGRVPWGEGGADHAECPDCRGSGEGPSGALDPFRLSLVADALEEAGCDSPYLLAHLRGDFVNAAGERVIGCHRDLPHVKGCWAVDLVLGKS